MQGILLKEKFALKKGSTNFKVVFKSKSQEHSFNYPYQVGISGDSPEKAIEKNIRVQEKDLVILGSDGLFDNMYTWQVLDEVEKNWENELFEGQQLAETLTHEAYQLSVDDEYMSPVCLERIVKHKNIFEGGKSDDIFVVLGRIQRAVS